MNNRLILRLSAILAAAILGACGQSGASFDISAHNDEIMAWRDGRRDRLLRPYGYLTQTGLHWLKPGRYSFGTDASNDIVFSGPGDARIGEFTVSEGGVLMTVEESVDVRYTDEPVTSIAMAADTTDDPVTVTHRTLAWNVVERNGRYGIRARDIELPFAKNFGQLSYFDIDPALRVQATLRRYPEPIEVRGETVIEGLEYRPESPGVVVFEIGGEEFELEAFSSDDELFYVFGDLTNRDDTYGAGRFLYSELPGEDGLLVLDFNKAYSPPCAFNDFSTCPVASPRNRLAIRVEAGELYDPALHYSGDR